MGAASVSEGIGQPSWKAPCDRKGSIALEAGLALLFSLLDLLKVISAPHPPHDAEVSVLIRGGGGFRDEIFVPPSLPVTNSA